MGVIRMKIYQHRISGTLVEAEFLDDDRVRVYHESGLHMIVGRTWFTQNYKEKKSTKVWQAHNGAHDDLIITYNGQPYGSYIFERNNITQRSGIKYIGKTEKAFPKYLQRQIELWKAKYSVWLN
jgi:hypothetical protein